MIGVEEIDQIIRGICMNLTIEQARDVNNRLFIRGCVTGVDMERNKYRISAPGESDWNHMYIQVMTMYRLIDQRINAHLITLQSERPADA